MNNKSNIKSPFYNKYKAVIGKNKVFVIVLSVLLIFPQFTITAFAGAPTNTSQTVYGTISKSITNTTTSGEELVIDLAIATYKVQNARVCTYTYQFNRPCDGTFKVDFLYSTQNFNYELFVEGGFVVTYTNADITFQVQGSDRFVATMIIRLPNAFEGQIWGITHTISMNLLDYSDSEAMNETVELLSQVDGYVQTMNTNVQAIRNVLMSMSGYDTNGNIATDFDSVIYDLDTLVQAISTSNQQLIVMNSYLQSLNIPIYSQSIYRVLSNNNIANLNQDGYGNYITVNANTNYTTYLYGAGAPYCMIYAVNATNVYPVFSNSNISCTVKRTIRTNGLVVNYVEIVNNSGGNGNFTFTFNNSSNNRNIYPYFLGYSRAIPIDLMWACADFYNDAYTSKLNEVISAINNMELDVTNMTVNTTGITYNITSNQVNNSTTNYNYYINQVYSVENNITYTLDQFLEIYEDEIDDYDVIQHKSLYFYNPERRIDIISDEIVSEDFFGLPITITLIGFVIMAILG